MADCKGCEKLKLLASEHTCIVKGRTFICEGCKREVPWDFGAADEYPNHCDDCWVAIMRPKMEGPQHAPQRS